MTDELAKKDPRLEVAFGSIWTTLNRLRDETDATNHDIATKDGHAAAVTLCANLRKERKPITDAHKTIKADALEFCRLVDSEKNMAIALLDETIAIYAEPLQKMKDDEKARIAEIRSRIDAMGVGPDIAARPTAEIIAKRDEINAVVVGASFAELAEEANIKKVAALRCLSEAIERGEKRDADAAELEAGRKKLAEQAEQLRIQAAEKAAADRATADAAAKVKAAEDAKMRAEAEAKQQANRAEEAKAEAARVARQAVIDAEAQQMAIAQGEAARRQEQADRAARAAASMEDKRAAMIEEVGAYLGEPEAEALYAGIASGNIKTLVMI